MTDNRMGTAQRMRMGTAARQQTAMKEVNYSGVGYNTKVNSVDRPVTNHGMMGITNGTAGPGRQIYDRKYYGNVLKQKNNDIVAEISKMKTEVEDINRDNNTYLTLERKYETLIKDVRRYEGELADYNLALDKHRSDTKPDDIEALYIHIKNQNDKQRQHLDALFAEKRDTENEVQSYEQQIQEIQYANESRLNDLDPEQRNEYDRLKRENQGLQTDINNQRQELEDVNTRLAQAEARLRADQLKQRAQHLRDEKTQLTKRKEDLELQTNEMNLPFPEARERLMNRIKQDNADIKMQEKDIADARKMVETYTKSVRDIENDLAGNVSQEKNEDSQKFEILYQKEKEINDFAAQFEQEKSSSEKEIAESQHIIKALLEHMQKNLARQNKLPSQLQVDELKKDLNFKERQMNDAQSTAAKLAVEVEARQQDLEKIRSLEGRIDTEMATVADGINKMEDDMQNKFCRVDDLKAKFEREKARINIVRQYVAKYKNALKQQTTNHSMKHDTRRNQLQQSDIYTRLNEVEKRLISNESQIYAVNQYIEAKGAESNYQGLFQQSMALCADINNEVIKKSLAA